MGVKIFRRVWLLTENPDLRGKQSQKAAVRCSQSSRLIVSQHAGHEDPQQGHRVIYYTTSLSGLPAKE